MSRIVVLGGGVVGLSTAIMLMRDGHDVIVVEGDRETLPRSPEEAWNAWERRGVAQFRQPHWLHAAGRHILDAHLPDLKEALLRAGCLTFNLMTLMPPFISDRAPRDGDERFITVTGRRPVIEYAIGTIAENVVDVRRGISVTGLLTGSATAKAVPHVTGVRTLDEKEISADLVIDAMGRRSQLPDWLKVIGARSPIEEAEDSGFIYYGRYFRSMTGAAPHYPTGLLTHFDSFSLLTLPSDAETWAVAVCISSRDTGVPLTMPASVRWWPRGAPRRRRM